MNEHTNTLESLQVEKTELETRLQIAFAKAELQAIEQSQNVVMMEAFGDWVDRREHLFDDPDFSRTPSQPLSTISDREDGKFLPIYQVEQDLQWIRGAGRRLARSFEAGVNILESLGNYTIGKGFEIDVQSDAEPPAGLLADVDYVLKTFMDENDWQADLEREIHDRSREDGETLLSLIPHGWHTEAVVIEMDQLTQPASPAQLEDWLCCGHIPSSWSFGVHTSVRNTARPFGYHVVYDSAGRDWDYLYESDALEALKRRTGLAEHIKRNVTRNAKRGVSDFWTVVTNLERVQKLLGNTVEGSAIQAAIAFIRENPPTSTQSQIEGKISGLSTATRQQPVSGGGSRTVRRQKFAPGTIIDTNGTKYHAGPLGGTNVPNFVQVIQATLRYVGIRWGFPEYMISGDASNNSFASTLMAESPFVKAREADQRFFKSKFVRIMWKVLRIAFEAGYFRKYGLTWLQFQQIVKVVVKPSEVATRNKTEEATVCGTMNAAGVMSKKTWAERSGLDYDAEQQNIRGESRIGTAPGDAVTTDGSGEPVAADAGITTALILNGAQIDSARAVLLDIRIGNIASEAAIELLAGVGIPRDKAEAMVTATTQMPLPKFDQDGKPIADGQSIDVGGEFSATSRLQWSRNRKAISDILSEVTDGKTTDLVAVTMLQTIGLSQNRAEALVKDAKDGISQGEITDADAAAVTTQESLAQWLDRASTRLFS